MNWQDETSRFIQCSFCLLCSTIKTLMNRMKEEKPRHLDSVFSNTTTYNHALSVFKLLGMLIQSSEGRKKTKPRLAVPSCHGR